MYIIPHLFFTDSLEMVAIGKSLIWKFKAVMVKQTSKGAVTLSRLRPTYDHTWQKWSILAHSWGC